VVELVAVHDGDGGGAAAGASADRYEGGANIATPAAGDVDPFQAGRGGIFDSLPDRRVDSAGVDDRAFGLEIGVIEPINL
jgi:hypothetical protein